jgi:hypothetical protein
MEQQLRVEEDIGRLSALDVRRLEPRTDFIRFIYHLPGSPWPTANIKMKQLILELLKDTLAADFTKLRWEKTALRNRALAANLQRLRRAPRRNHQEAVDEAGVMAADVLDDWQMSRDVFDEWCNRLFLACEVMWATTPPHAHMPYPVYEAYGHPN